MFAIMRHWKDLKAPDGSDLETCMTRVKSKEYAETLAKYMNGFGEVEAHYYVKEEKDDEKKNA